MNALELARYLHDQGLVVVDENGTNGNCFLYHMPNAPDVAVMVEVSGGPQASVALAYDNPVAHLIVRGTTDPTTSEVKAQAILSALHALDGVTLTDGTYVVSARALQSRPVHMGTDSNGRYEFSLNVQFEVAAEDDREG